MSPRLSLQPPYKNWDPLKPIPFLKICYEVHPSAERQDAHYILVGETVSLKKKIEEFFLINLGNPNLGPFRPKYKTSLKIGRH